MFYVRVSQTANARTTHRDLDDTRLVCTSTEADPDRLQSRKRCKCTYHTVGALPTEIEFESGTSESTSGKSAELQWRISTRNLVEMSASKISFRSSS